MTFMIFSKALVSPNQMTGVITTVSQNADFLHAPLSCGHLPIFCENGEKERGYLKITKINPYVTETLEDKNHDSGM